MPFLQALAPLSLFLLAAASFCSFVIFSKAILTEMPIFTFILIRYVYFAIYDLMKHKSSLTHWTPCRQVGIHILLAFINLGFTLCFFGAISQLQLGIVVAIYLSYPILTHWVLKAWMGKRLPKQLIWLLGLILIGYLSCFNSGLHLKNVFVFVAISAAFLKAIDQTGFSKLKISNSYLSCWTWRYLVVITCIGLLLIGTPIHFHWKTFLMVLIAAGLEKAYKYFFRLAKKNEAEAKTIIVFYLSTLICMTLDMIINHSFLPIASAMAVLLILGVSYLHVLRKNSLVNSLNDL